MLPKYAGLKSYYAFEKGTECWSISERGGRYLVMYLPRAKDGKGWTSHPDHVEFLPVGGSAEGAARRLADRILAHDVAPRGCLWLLEDPRVRAYQLAVVGRTNGDPHLYVGRRGPGEEPMELLREVLADWRLSDAIVQQNYDLRWLNYDLSLLNRLRGEGKRGSFTRPGCRLDAAPVAFDGFRAFLRWSLSVPPPYASVPETPLETAEADRIAEPMVAALCATAETGFQGGGPSGWEFWRLKPDFLNSGEELLSPEGEPVFFDSLGSNYAWLAAGRTQWFLLLLSAYPCPKPFDASEETER